MNRSIRTAIIVFVAALVIALVATTALAGEDDNHHPGPRAGAACTPGWQVGDEVAINTRHGQQTYRCEQRPGDPCPLWHWVYDPDVPKGQHRPRTCPQCPPSPSPSSAAPSSTPPSATTPPVSTSSTPAPRPDPTPDAPVRLPVTGWSTPPVWQIALAGAAALALGAVLVWFGAYRPRTRRRGGTI